MAKKILIVDDDPLLLKLLESFLTAHDFHVASAMDGDEGLEKIKQFKPDGIVLDVQMPRMNGYAFVFEVKKIEHAKDVPIIVLTSKQGMAEIFKVEGVKEYLTKPVQPQAVLEVIKKHIK